MLNANSLKVNIVSTGNLDIVSVRVKAQNITISSSGSYAA